ncbi:MAG: GNAT family N-acetyltransferase [Candidatus Ozemobacteraceae bacterium]
MSQIGETLVLKHWTGAPQSMGNPLPWDVYFEEAWIRLWGRQGGESFLFLYQSGDWLWAHPFVKLPIPGTDFYDAESAWGYGGPVSNTEDRAFLVKANEAFATWAREQRIVCAFTRFHAPLQNHRYCLDPDTRIIANRPVVSLPLKEPRPLIGKEAFITPELSERKETLEKDMSSAFRRGVRKARAAGLRFCEVAPLGHLSAFMKLYQKTMDRIGAAPEYYIDEARVRGLFCEPINARLFGVFDREHMVAGAVIISGVNMFHYHLGASDPAFLGMRPNNLLFYDMLFLLVGEGTHSMLHLGGGDDESPDNALLRFKRSLGGVESIYFTGGRIFLQTCYDELCQEAIKRRPDLAVRQGKFLKLYRL